MAFDSKGNLYVATGDQGEIHRVTPDGKGSVFFKTDETHVRSMAIDAHDNLIVGTDPGGLVLRVSPAGEGFVLYQMPKQEVTAVAVARDGAIYAAAVGTRQASTPPPPAPVPVAARAGDAFQPGGYARNHGHGDAPAHVRASSRISRALGRRQRRQRSLPHRGRRQPARIWSNAQDVVYAIAFDSTGRVLLGAGNKGDIYRIESPTALHFAAHHAGDPDHRFPAGP